MNNNNEHNWAQAGEDGVRCAECDARYGGKWHDLPCGQAEEEEEK